MLGSQSVKFPVQYESLTDPKVKIRNENELCRIAKRLSLHRSLLISTVMLFSSHFHYGGT